MKSRTILGATGMAIVFASAAVASHSEAAATPVSALRMHVRLLRTTPADSAVITAPSKDITLWFSAAPEIAVTTVKLTAANGTVIPTDTPKQGDTSLGTGGEAAVIASIKEALRPGIYNVEWKTAARDGHPANGTFMFTVALPR